MSVNGAATVEVAITNITTSTWTTSVAGSFPLTSGTNTISFANDWGWYFIDSISVNPSIAAPIVSVNVTSGATAEAENGILGGTNVDTATAGYSGTGYVTGFTDSTDNVTITLFSEVQGLYNVVVRYAGIYGGKQTTMSLNGASAAEIVFADTSTAASPWANATAGQVLLNAGNNTITFIDDWYVQSLHYCQ
jgi:mannan endo-1,4-beta-mannosidase